MTLEPEVGLELREPERSKLPNDVLRRFQGGVATDSDLRRVSEWLLAERLAGPDCVKYVSGVWNENLLAIERRLAQAYRDRGVAAPESLTGKAVKVYRGDDGSGEDKGGGDGSGRRGVAKDGGRKRKKFGDDADGEYEDEVRTLEDYVERLCGWDSEEWKEYQRLKGMFGVPLEEAGVEDVAAEIAAGEEEDAMRVEEEEGEVV